MVTKLDVNTVDLWVADTNARIISRQSTQDNSFAVQVQPGSSYLLFAFDEDDENGVEWTAETLNQRLSLYFGDRNNDANTTYKINWYQLIGFANTRRVVNFDGGTDVNPDFYSTLSGSFKLSFDLLPGVTLPSLPKNVLDLFESNQIQSKVARHFQQPYKNFSVALVDGVYSTKYMAVVVVNAVGKEGEGDVVIDTPNYTLTDYFTVGANTDEDEKTDPLFTSVQNLGYLLNDKRSLEVLKDYYKITLFGSNQMRMTVGNRISK